MDFEKIRLETVKEFENKLNRQGGPIDGFIDSIIKIASQISKEMLIKYHEELNSK